MWIALAAVYGILKGIRDVMKKVALKKSSTIEVLFFYSLISLILLIPTIGDAAAIFTSGSLPYLGFILIKSFVIYVAWICSFKAIENLPIGFYGIMDMSRVVITSVLSVTLLGEAMTLDKAIGMVLVLDGLVLVNMIKNEGLSKSDKIKPVFVLLVVVSCCMNSVSEIFDKWLMRPETGLTTGQLQFWYMFFLTAMYFIHILVKKIHIDWRAVYKNYWIAILAVLFVIGDKALFVANRTGDVIPMTLLKQSAILVTIIGGKLVFKEKKTTFKLLCAVTIICGIIIGVNN